MTGSKSLTLDPSSLDFEGLESLGLGCANPIFWVRCPSFLCTARRVMKIVYLVESIYATKEIWNLFSFLSSFQNAENYPQNAA